MNRLSLLIIHLIFDSFISLFEKKVENHIKVYNLFIKLVDVKKVIKIGMTSNDCVFWMIRIASNDCWVAQTWVVANGWPFP